ncbi:MAG: TetR/AcrR family transcriptional regulator [Ilumatobacteraceae bacterium]
MEPAAVPPAAGRVLASRERIVEAARDEVLSKGILGLRVQDVAAKAKVSVPLIYKYFADRDGLLAEVLGRMFEEIVLEYVEASEEFFAHLDNPTVDDLAAVFARPSEELRKGRRWLRVQIMAASMEIPALRERLTLVQGHINERTSQFMEMAQQRIAGRVVISPRALAIAVQATGMGLVLNDLVEDADKVSDDEHYDMIRAMLASALELSPDPARK